MMDWRRDSTRRRLIFVLAVGSMGPGVAPGQSPRLYWTSGGGTWRSDFEGDSVQRVTENSYLAIAIDQQASKLYWSQFEGGIQQGQRA